MTYAKRNKLRLLSNQTLLETISGCEEAVTKGTAQIADYKRFVVCAEELTRRRRLQAGVARPVPG